MSALVLISSCSGGAEDSGEPADRVGQASQAAAAAIHFGYGHYNSFWFNAGQEAFHYPVPAGFTPGLYGSPDAVCE